MDRRRRRRVLIGTLGVLLVLYLGASWSVAKRIVSPRPGMPARPSSLTTEALADGSTMWVQESGAQPKAAFVFVHGLAGNMEHWVGAMSSLAKQGYASVTIAMPGHDDSPHEKVGFGPLESKVVILASQAARKRWPGTKIVLVGVSLGGSACWLAVAKDPTCADGVVTESAFARLDPAVDGWFSRRLGSVGPIVFAPTRWIATGMAGVNPSAVNPVEGARAFKGPCAVLHAEDDKVIARFHGEELAKAARVPLQILPDCSHAQGYGTCPEQLERAMIDVASRCRTP